jgi:hypothetical protein
MKNEKRKEVYDRPFKLKFFGNGEWIYEPDLVEFEYEELLCIVVRVVKREPFNKEEVYFGGHLCGYIFLPEDHPLYGKETEDIEIDSYQGITYTQKTREGWMIGFDCAHSGDLIPSMEHMRNPNPEIKKMREIYTDPEGYEKCPLFNPTYKNMDFCIKECKSLAKQAAKMKVSE